jgi:TonB family protein
LKELMQSGVVLIHISSDGRCSDVDLLKSSGYEELDNQVLGAVQHWRFAPPMRGNTPVESTYKHTVIFGANEEVVDYFSTRWREVKLTPAK